MSSTGKSKSQQRGKSGALSPWDIAAQTKLEASQQRALFAWANMVEFAGFAAARDPRSWNEPGYARFLIEAGHSKPEPRLKWFHAIKNAEKGGAIRGSMAKAEGVKAGVSDCLLPVMQTFPNPLFAIQAFEGGFPHCEGITHDERSQWAYCGLYIELKIESRRDERNGGASQEQLDFFAFVRSEGYAAILAHGWIEAAQAIERYLGVNL